VNDVVKVAFMQKNIKYEFNKATLDRRVLYTFFLFLVSLYFVVQLLYYIGIKVFNTQPTIKTIIYGILLLLIIILMMILEANDFFGIYDDGFTVPISPTTYRKYGEGRFVSFQSIKKVEAFIYKGGRNKVLYIHLKNREVLYIPMHSIGKKPFEILFQELENHKVPIKIIVRERSK